MAQSTCPKCESTSFEVETNFVNGLKFSLDFIQCSVCGTVVGIIDRHNSDADLIRDMESKIDDIQSKLEDIESKVEDVQDFFSPEDR